MSEKKPSNPYAFPLSVSTPASVEYTTGMTLRDYFAANALMGNIASLPQYANPDPDSMAEFAYEMADAMLRAREMVVTAVPAPSEPPLSSADSSGRTG